MSLVGLLNGVDFGPDDVRAVANGTASVRCIRAVLTSQTCGEPCWHAREEVCRCSCGGRNHGCLLTKDGVKPPRMAKIDGHRYILVAVGEGAREAARELNSRQWRSVEKPFQYGDSLMQYKYSWADTDCGAPGRCKWATPQQVEKWEELSAYRGMRERPLLCWQIETMPEAPTEPVIDGKKPVGR